MQGLRSESESQEIYPDSCAYTLHLHTLHLQRISAATRAGLVVVEMKEKTFRNILDIAKKAGVTRRFLTTDQA
jgi:hypothetical protein